MTAVLCRRGQHLRRHWDAEEYPRALRDAGQSVISFFLHLTTLRRRQVVRWCFPGSASWCSRSPATRCAGWTRPRPGGHPRTGALRAVAPAGVDRDAAPGIHER